MAFVQFLEGRVVRLRHRAGPDSDNDNDNRRNLLQGISHLHSSGYKERRHRLRDVFIRVTVGDKHTRFTPNDGQPPLERALGPKGPAVYSSHSLRLRPALLDHRGLPRRGDVLDVANDRQTDVSRRSPDSTRACHPSW